MAEFQKVMHEWKRMCAATSFCEVCPLKDEKCWATSPASMVGDSKSIESIIMAWASENPEPVYPTWAEWLNSTGLTKHDTGQFCVHTPNQYSYEVKGVDILNEVAYKPIPADIAQKLGLQPKK